MNKSAFYLLLFCINLLLCSCDPLCENVVEVYVNNETGEKFLLFGEYPGNQTYNTRDTILPYESNLVLSKYVDGPSHAPLYKYVKLWIYNGKDSTYIIYSNFKPLNSNENFIVNNDIIQNKEDKRKNNLIIYNTDFIFTINESLVSKMKKNTHLTDSVFELKK